MTNDAIKRLRDLVEETYAISDHDADRLIEIIKAMDLPKPAILYTTFLHPEAKND
jgi:hypothetical protein